MNKTMLRKAFRESGLKQNEIVKKCKISKSQVSRLVNGLRDDVTCDTARRLINGLNMDPITAMTIFFNYNVNKNKR